LVEVLILFYSRSGDVEAMAKAVAEGVNSVKGATSKLVRVDDAHINDLISCDAVAFGSPNYFGYMAGLMKDFFDRAWSVREKVAGKLAVAFTCGGSSSNAALLSLEAMYVPFKLQKVTEGVAWGVKDHGSPNQRDLEACKKLGEALVKATLEKKLTS